MIDDDAPFFVRNPIAVDLNGEIPESVALPLHQIIQIKEFELPLNPPMVHIESNDADGLYRLKEFADVESNGILGSIERSDKRPIIHWVSESTSKEATLIIQIKKKCNTFRPS